MFSFTSIKVYQHGLLAGNTTCAEAVDHYLQAIANSSCNAFVEVYADEARRRARELDALSQKAPLHGVVIGIKDNICYEGHTSAAASRMLQGFQSLYSATAVQRLLDAGAIIIGRQNCDEFGMGSTNENSYYGPALHPLSPDHVAGGSSGGSAAAVKAGLCMASLGSDTGGSVRLPASFCGVVGFKPTYGRISRHGLIAYGSSLDSIGILANTVEDVSLLLEVIAGPDQYDSTALQTGLSSVTEGNSSPNRIAYFKEWFDHPSLDQEFREQSLQFFDLLRGQGHTVQAIPFPFTDYIVPAYYVLATAEASSNLARYEGARFGYRSAKKAEDSATFYKQNRTEGFGFEVKKRIMLGSFVLSAGYYEAYTEKAQRVRKLLLDQTTLIFNDFDFLFAPVATGPAYRLNERSKDPIALYLGDIFTVFANLTGLPALSLPIFKHSSNLSLGLGVHASPQNEVPLLRFAHQLMQQ